MPALTSATLNGSARGPSAALCPCPPSCPSAPAATPSALSLHASDCPLLSPPSPFPTTAPPPFCRPVAPGPSLLTVSALSGDEGDDTSADIAEDGGEGGCGAAPACMGTTSALSAGGWLNFGSGLWDIAHMDTRLSPAPKLPLPQQPTPFTPSARAPYVYCALGTPAAPLPHLPPRDLRTSPGGHRPRSGLHCRCPRPHTRASLLLSACVS